MSRVQLKMREVSRKGTLPEVCMHCGEPSTTKVRKNFSWCPPWVPILIVAGLLPYVIVAVMLTKRMQVPVPFCEDHKNHWRWRAWFIYGGLAVVSIIFLAAFAVVIYLSEQKHPHPPEYDIIMGIACATSALIGLAWLIAAAVVQSTGIRPTEITDFDITLTGVHDNFADALEDQRDREPRKRRVRYEDDYEDDYDDEED